jgi:hypothetical protein
MYEHGLKDQAARAGLHSAFGLMLNTELGSGPIIVKGAIRLRLREKTEDERPVLADGGADGAPAAIFPKEPR